MRDDLSKGISSDDPSVQLKRAVLALTKARARLVEMENTRTEPIAIIGMSCRFPGGIDNPEAFWQLLARSGDAITEVPPERWDIDAYYDPEPGTRGKMYTRYGGFLQDIEQFDAHFFGIAPREALTMDPQQRLLLEMAWEALEHAGLPSQSLFGSSAGIFIAIGPTEYLQLQKSVDKGDQADGYLGTGNAPSIAAGRLSYMLGVHGPSIALDTACSSSLVATHLACQSLRQRECNLALVGSVNLILSPDNTIYFSLLRAMARDGHCKAFDERADGYVRGEGGGVLVLKRLSDAEADGDRILAIIRGSAVKQDGRSSGLTAPNGLAQEAVIREALAAAKVKAEQVDFIEAHGTGTSLGDPIEMRALGNVFGSAHTTEHPFFVGAVKTNIGHIEAAAGMASLIKTILAFEHEEIPPLLHLQQPNPYIAWDKIPVILPLQRTPWPMLAERRRMAGVSAFGIGGTNAHIILEETPDKPGPKVSAAMVDGPEKNKVFLLTLSARSSQALYALIQAYVTLLEKQTSLSARDICATAALRRNHYEHRFACLGQTPEELLTHMMAFLKDQTALGTIMGQATPGHQREVIFVCPGQGSQWEGMGQQLFAQETVFREAILNCETAMRPYVSWSLSEHIQQGTPWENLAVIQPTLFAFSISLAALWRSWGVVPDAVIGHSMGEVAAACIAGILSLEEGARLICQRSQILHQISGQGGMLLVELTEQQARIEITGLEEHISIAVCNSPRATVLAGEVETLERVKLALEERAVFSRWIKVDVASHSPQVDRLHSELVTRLKGIKGHAGSLAFYSTVQGRQMQGSDLNEEYWLDNLRRPVQFGRTIALAWQEGYETFVELSPHPILTYAIQETLEAEVEREVAQHSVIIGSLRRQEPERAMMLRGLGHIYVHGGEVAWAALFGTSPDRVDLPLSPFQRERFWFTKSTNEINQGTEISAVRTRSFQKQRISGKGSALSFSHPLLQNYLAPAHQPGVACWECEMTPETFPYLIDHQVQGEVVAPATLYIDGVLSAAAEQYPEKIPVLEELHFLQMLTLPSFENTERTDKTTVLRRLQLIFIASSSETITFRYMSMAPTHENLSDIQTQDWTLHVQGLLRLVSATETADAGEALEQARERCLEAIVPADHYRTLRDHGLAYGPFFQGMRNIWRGQNEAVGLISLPEALQADAHTYCLHPALLDACFQMTGGALPTEIQVSNEIDEYVRSAPTYVPASIERLHVYQRSTPEQLLWCHVTLRERLSGTKAKTEDRANDFHADIQVIDANGLMILEIDDLRLQYLPPHSDVLVSEKNETSWLDWLHTLRWQTYIPPLSWQDKQARQGTWFLFCTAFDAGLSTWLPSFLAKQGARCILITAGTTYICKNTHQFQVNPLVPEDWQHLFQDTCGSGQPPCQGVIYSWPVTSSLEWQDTASIEQAVERGTTSVVSLVQAIAQAGWRDAPRLWLLTRGVHALPDETNGKPGAALTMLEQSPVWGLSRTIMCEHPEMKCISIDLDPWTEQENANEVEAGLLTRLFQSNCTEEQIALRGKQYYTVRLIHWENTSQDNFAELLSAAGDRPFSLDTTSTDSEQPIFRAIERRQPAAGEVEIKVAYTTLPLFTKRPGRDTEWEETPNTLFLAQHIFAGRISAKGDDVATFTIGDEVIAIGQEKPATYSMLSSLYVEHKPTQVNQIDVIAQLLAWMAAIYTLRYAGQLQAGERLLLLQATNLTGRAMARVAQHMKAELIIAEATSEIHTLLRDLKGLQIVDSHNPSSFVQKIRDLTHGQGIDMVVNLAFTEDRADTNVLLQPRGRWIQIMPERTSNTDELPVYVRKNVLFLAVDLANLATVHPTLYQTIFHEALAFMREESHTLTQEQQIFPVSQLHQLYTSHQQKQTGIDRVIISWQSQRDTYILPAQKEPVSIQAEATYLITGGLGGLGLTLVRWLVEQGARYIVLLNRTGASSAQREELQALQSTGAHILAWQADITQQNDMAAVFKTIMQQLPPVRGVIHAAAVLDDGILLKLQRERIKKVLAPKVAGAWNLHLLTQGLELDFFLLFSSTASLLGAPGQSNYAAANAFLDALAYYRQSWGLPALSINWGPWAEIGLAAQVTRSKSLINRGMSSIPPHQGLEIVRWLLGKPVTQLGVFSLNLRQWYQANIGASEFSLLSELAPTTDSVLEQRKRGKSIRETLQKAEAGERYTLLENHVRAQISQVLQREPTSIDGTTALGGLGFDSLMAMELRNRLEELLELTLPATLVWSHRTIAALTKHLAQQLDGGQQTLPEVSSGVQETQQIAPDVAEVEGLSHSAVAQLLLAELEDLPEEFTKGTIE